MRIMTLPETDGVESCLAFVSGNFGGSLRCASVPRGRWDYFLSSVQRIISYAVLYCSKPFVSGS